MLDDNFLLRCKEDEIPIITKEEIEDELWEEEYHSSSLMGRSVMTGY